MNENEFPQQITNGGFDEDAHFDMASLKTGELEFDSDSFMEGGNQIQIPPPNQNIDQLATQSISIQFESEKQNITPQRQLSDPIYTPYDSHFSNPSSTKQDQQSSTNSTIAPQNIENNQMQITIPMNVSMPSNDGNIMVPLSNFETERTTHRTCCSKFAWFCSMCWCDFEKTVFQATQRTDYSLRKATAECHRWIDNFFYNNCNSPK